jgi:hypothetical protein
MNIRSFISMSFATAAILVAAFSPVGPPLAQAATPAAMLADDRTVIPMAQIKPADKGKSVTVEGTVVGTQNFTSGFRLYVNDGTAQVQVIIWESDWDHIYSSYHLNVGAVVQVTGEVDVYRDQIELVPEWGSDVRVVKWAKRNWRKYDLGALNGNDHNAVVWVQGTIADITPAKDGSGVYVLIWDATGAQKVHLYNVVVERIPRREQLWIGQQVSVVGRVKARRRVGIEIVPALPHDVYIGAAAKDDGAGAAAGAEAEK